MAQPPAALGIPLEASLAAVVHHAGRYHHERAGGYDRLYGVFGIWGETYLPTANTKYGIATDSLSQRLGLRDGDKILR